MNTLHPFVLFVLVLLISALAILLWSLINRKQELSEAVQSAESWQHSHKIALERIAEKDLRIDDLTVQNAKLKQDNIFLIKALAQLYPDKSNEVIPPRAKE